MSVMIQVSFDGDAEFEPSDCGMDDDCTAEDVVRAMMQEGSIDRALNEWDLIPADITVIVVRDTLTEHAKRPTTERTFSSWSLVRKKIADEAEAKAAEATSD